MKVIVIGGGPAGMMAAITAADQGHKVIIIEKNKEFGRKLLITGKGRCNITNSIDIDEFVKNIPGNGKFLYSAFSNFTNLDIIDFLIKNGVRVKVERGNRVFPDTDKSQDVLKAFEKAISKRKIQIIKNTRVTDILLKNNKIFAIEVMPKERIACDAVILATGGKSYPGTGSTGDGYEIAKKLGHTIVPTRGSIVPLESNDFSCRELQGLSLRNVGIVIKDIENNKKIYEDFGEMLFTHFGVSGPTILSSSAHLVRYKGIGELFNNNKIKLYIDLKPALDEEKLDQRILRDFDEFKNKEFKNSLSKLLPKKFIPIIVAKTKMNPDKKVNEITQAERRKLIKAIKEFDVTINGFRPVEEAIVTAGGISTKEINPATMESKIVPNLYFAGEIIDVDAYTGGFNLQIAYSTGYTAGLLKKK